MKLSYKTILSITLSVVVTTLVIGAITFASWNDASGIPPQNNTPEPINSGPVAQVKDGPLTIRGLIETTAGGIKFPDGSV